MGHVITDDIMLGCSNRAPSERISDVYILPTPRPQRAAQATTIAPRWQTLWRQHGPFGGTLACIFGPRIWRGRQTPLYRGTEFQKNAQQRYKKTSSEDMSLQTSTKDIIPVGWHRTFSTSGCGQVVATGVWSHLPWRLLWSPNFSVYEVSFNMFM